MARCTLQKERGRVISRRKLGLRKRQCGTVMPPEDMSANDREEIAKFGQCIRVMAAAKAGAPEFAVRAAVASIYPDVAGQIADDVDA